MTHDEKVPMAIAAAPDVASATGGGAHAKRNEDQSSEREHEVPLSQREAARSEPHRTDTHRAEPRSAEPHRAEPPAEAPHRSDGHRPEGHYPEASHRPEASAADHAPEARPSADAEKPKPKKKKKRGPKPNNVRKMRIERMMSKAELARRANLSVLTIDRVEKGFGCRMDTKRKILEALGLSLADRVRVFGEEE